jgi:hypothetical protein
VEGEIVVAATGAVQWKPEVRLWRCHSAPEALGEIVGADSAATGAVQTTVQWKAPATLSSRNKQARKHKLSTNHGKRTEASLSFRVRSMRVRIERFRKKHQPGKREQLSMALAMSQASHRRSVANQQKKAIFDSTIGQTVKK